jgi:hypothetical protein
MNAITFFSGQTPFVENLLIESYHAICLLSPTASISTQSALRLR